jgi:hypothetical protein
MFLFNQQSGRFLPSLLKGVRLSAVTHIAIAVFTAVTHIAIAVFTAVTHIAIAVFTLALTHIAAVC